MTWSKVGQTTNAWITDTASGSFATTNAVGQGAGAGTGVIEEVIAFWETRGWVVNSNTTSTPDADTVNHYWTIYKDYLLENGSTERRGFYISYQGKTDTADSFKFYHWDYSTDGVGQVIISSNLEGFAGKWSFWTSDQDAESYLILANNGSNTIVGFQPPAGSTFQNGYYSVNHPSASGIAPMHYGSGPAYNGAAGANNRFLEARLAGIAAGMPNTREKLDFTWVCDDYGAPVFHTEGGDISLEIDYSKSDVIGPTNTSRQTSYAVKYGSKYYISIGNDVKMLFDCGTSPIVF